MKIGIRNNQFCFTNEQLEEIDKFKQEHDNTEVEFELTPIKELRTSQAFGYYRGVVLPAFVPDHFDTPQEAHLYFSNLYLQQLTVIDLTEEDITKHMQDIITNASRSRNSIKVQKTPDRIIIGWVKSTMMLKKKEMVEYMNMVMKFGQEQGIIFPEIS